MSRHKPLISTRREDLLVCRSAPVKDETSWNASNVFLRQKSHVAPEETFATGRIGEAPIGSLSTTLDQRRFLLPPAIGIFTGAAAKPAARRSNS